ncbi:hypothetical protein Dimus_034228 [Dionaea muscipula]
MAKRGRPRRVQVLKSTPTRAQNGGNGDSSRCNLAAPTVQNQIDPNLIDVEVVQDVPPAILKETRDAIERIVENPSSGESSGKIGSGKARVENQPYLRAVKGAVGEFDNGDPNPLAGNRDTRRGLQLSNE